MVRDLENPRSLVNIVPPAFRNAIENLAPYLLTLPEKKLKHECQPDPVDSSVRMRFWGEYYQAQDEKRKMRIENVTFGATSKEYIYGRILKNSKLLAWIIRPPRDLAVQQSEALSTAIAYQRDILEEIMEKKLYLVEKVTTNKNGSETKTTRLNAQALTEIRKISESLSMRVQGAIVQKLAVDQRHTHRIGGGPPSDTIDVTALPETDLDQLESLNKTLSKLNKSLDASEVVDAQEVSDDGSVQVVRGKEEEDREPPGAQEAGQVSEDEVEVEALHVDSPGF